MSPARGRDSAAAPQLSTDIQVLEEISEPTCAWWPLSGRRVTTRGHRKSQRISYRQKAIDLVEDAACGDPSCQEAWWLIVGMLRSPAACGSCTP